MKPHTTRMLSARRTGLAAALLVGSLGLALLPVAAPAQINRAKPPQPNSSPQNPAQQQPSLGMQQPPSVYLPQPNVNRSGPMIPGYNGGLGQNGMNYNPLFGNGLLSGPGLQGSVLRPGIHTNPPNLPSATGPFNRRWGGFNRSVGGPFLNPPSTPLENLFGGRPGGSQYYEPSLAPSNLFGGSATVPPSAINRGASLDRFRRSREGRRYAHGLYNYNWGNAFFPGGVAFYPYYYPDYVPGVTILSPYADYSGVYPPYIGTSNLTYAPPQYIYVPVPVYNDSGAYQGDKSDDVDDYYLNRDQARQRAEDNKGYRIGEDGKANTPIDNAVSDLQKAWQNGDADLLAKHVPNDAQIAVYLRGKYQYSLDAGDYLDMTRDAFRDMTTVRFDLDQVHLKQNGIYTVTGRHIYRNKNGDERTVYVSFVLEKKGDQFVITQVGTSPDRIEE
jgi:hypothetical protein